MALTAAQSIALALEASHSGTGKGAQALAFLNSILTDECQNRDYAEARGQYVFTFAPNTGPPVVNSIFQPSALTAGGFYPSYPGNQFGSGPYVLPLDYLRLSGSSGSSGSQKSFIWWLQGVPYPVIPMDLAEFDLQVQQAGLQSFVWLSASDLSAPIDDRILLQTTGDTTAGSNILTNVASTTRLIGGNVLGVAGQGIVPGTMLTSLGSTPPPVGGGTVVAGGGGTVVAGGGGTVEAGGGTGSGSGSTVVSGGGGTTESGGGGTVVSGGSSGGGGGGGSGGTVVAGGGGTVESGGGGTVVVGGGSGGGGGTGITLSQPANATITGASIFFGYCPVVYIYPPPQSALQAMIRYQRRMPPIVDVTRYPWLHFDGPVFDKLTSRLCKLNDDDRWQGLNASAEMDLSQLLASKDDDPSHPKRVELDRRAFGRGWIGSQKITKRVGW